MSKKYWGRINMVCKRLCVPETILLIVWDSFL